LFAVSVLCQQASVDTLAQARSLLATGKLADSESVLRDYIHGHPSSAEAHFLLGYVLFRKKEAKESLGEFTAGAALRRPHADELKIVASDYVMLGDYGDADKWFTAVVVEKPDDYDAWYLLGRAKFNESNFTAAVSSFERALTLRPKHVDAENNLGLAWMELNDTEKAQAAFQNAIDWQGEAPTDPQPFLNLGLCSQIRLTSTRQFFTSQGLLRWLRTTPDSRRTGPGLCCAGEVTTSTKRA